MKSAILIVMVSFLSAFAGNANAQPQTQSGPDRRLESASPTSGAGEEAPSRLDNETQVTPPSSVCKMIEAAAATNQLPYEFFSQIIWEESRLKSDAVGPTTRSGQRAEGIAQFMPTTAAERFLQDPFDPIQALPKSAEFLRDLRAQFGNLGLAAAAYNAGPQRVRDWLTGKRPLPSETQIYVRDVTGHTVDEWARPDQKLLTIAKSRAIPCDAITKPVEKAESPPRLVQPDPILAWGVQLIGDRSENKALAAYRQLQKKHEAILGEYQPVVIRTTLKVGAAPIWSRVRIDADSRQTAATLCSRLRAAGENCLIQRN
jgi:hypothetical protein